jgi:hypothetical protein
VQHVQALGPTAVAIIAAFIAGYIALRQWWTAHDRLRFDLFEKRFAVYQATQTLINGVTLHGQISMEDMGEFYHGIRGAEFLFDGTTRDFLTKIGEMAFKARMKRHQLEKQPDHPNSHKLIDEEEDILEFLRDQNPKLEKDFRRFLDLSKVGLLRKWSSR